MKYLLCSVAGFLLAMGIAQARGLNAKPWVSRLAAAPSVSTDPEKVRAQALHEAILAVHNSRFYKGGLDCNYNGVRNAERVLREQLGARLNYPAHTCGSEVGDDA